MKTLKTSERVLIAVCAVVILIAVWLKLNPSGPAAGTRTLLPPGQARQKTEVALRTIARLGDEQAEMEPRLAQRVYDQSPDQLVPRVIRDLQRIAERAGVHLREIKPARPRELTTAAVTRVPLEVRFSAPFQPNVMRFLYYVEDPAGKMAVDKLDLTPAEKSFKTVDVSAQIIVFTRAAAGTASAEGGPKNGIGKLD